MNAAKGPEPEWGQTAQDVVRADREGVLSYTQIDCAGCFEPLADGPLVVAGGDTGDVYYHERCVQP